MTLFILLGLECVLGLSGKPLEVATKMAVSPYHVKLDPYTGEQGLSHPGPCQARGALRVELGRVTTGLKTLS
jgi:hypothetical protein